MRLGYFICCLVLVDLAAKHYRVSFGAAMIFGIPVFLAVSVACFVAAVTIQRLSKTALNAARLQCPLFDSLPLEKQLQYLEEDLLKRRQHTVRLLDLLGFEQNERAIAKLKKKIAQRDRGSGRGTSVTA
jgi:hypothetical protein